MPHDDLEQEQMYLIAPPRILGWSTRSKSWCQFSIRGISSAKSANATVFEKELQLDPSYKAMIKALVRNHKNGENTSEVKNPDLIEGKGRSLVILLHGGFFGLYCSSQGTYTYRSSRCWQNCKYTLPTLFIAMSKAV